jgi:ubiquinone/menaquinone biosynthesis C-methylase UbiE
MTSISRQAPPFPPTNIYELSIAQWHTKLLISAAKVGIFDALGQDGQATADELSDRLGLYLPALRDTLDCLVALGLLERTADRYRNSPETGYYLVPGSPNFMGGYLGYVEKFIMPAWDTLPDLLQNGPAPAEPAAAPKPEPGEPQAKGKNFYQEGYRDNNTIRLVLSVAESLTVELAWILAKEVDWSNRSRLVDLGGGRGKVASVVLEANPQLHATVFDLPPLLPFFEEFVKELGLADRMRFEPGDWFSDALPEGDVMLCGHALHNWETDRKRLVLDKAYRALRPGGMLLVYDLMIDEERRRPNPLMLSLLMRLRRMGGAGYSAAECADIMKSVGFAEVEHRILADHDGHTLLIAHKR